MSSMKYQHFMERAENSTSVFTTRQNGGQTYMDDSCLHAVTQRTTLTLSLKKHFKLFGEARMATETTSNGGLQQRHVIAPESTKVGHCVRHPLVRSKTEHSRRPFKTVGFQCFIVTVNVIVLFLSTR